MILTEALLALLFGFVIHNLLTKPKYLKKKVPRLNAGPIEILPSLKIKFKNKTVHLHHWIWLSAAIGISNHLAQGISNLIFLKLFALGGIFQGLTFKDRFEILRQQTTKIKRWPAISVVIPAHNEEKFIAKTLTSVKKQDYKGKFEIIVVNNASSDKTAKIAQKLGAKVIFEGQKGLPFARQLGFKTAKYGLVASTDADIILPKNWLTRLTISLMSDPKLVATGGWFTIKKGSIFSKFGVNLLSQPMIYLYSFIFRKSLLLDQNYIVKKRAFITVGGYKGLPAMMEDLALAQRLKKVGKVKMNYGKSWTVVSSPRRFTGGLLPGAMPYIINGLSFAIIGKVLSPNFTDIRSEEIKRSKLTPIFSSVLTVAIIIFTLLTVPISPAHAKAAKLSKKLRHNTTQAIYSGSKIAKKDFAQISHAAKKIKPKASVAPTAK